MQVQDTELIQALPKSNQQLESDHVAQTSIKIGQTEFIKVCRAQAISLLHFKSHFSNSSSLLGNLK